MTLIRLRRAASATAIAIVGLGLLSGCFALDKPVGGAAIGIDGDELEIAVCESVVMVDGKVTYRQLSVANEWVIGWTFAGGDINAGTVLSTDPEVTPPFKKDVRGNIPLDPGTEILVAIAPGAKASDSVDAGFVIPDDGIASGMWLQANGDETDEPCP